VSESYDCVGLVYVQWIDRIAHVAGDTRAMCLVPVIPLSWLPDLLLALAVAHPKNLFLRPISSWWPVTSTLYPIEEYMILNERTNLTNGSMTPSVLNA
jgi:hypothetical protein